MTKIPGYDSWKTHNPDDDRCEFCDALQQGGWQPDECTGECGRRWRDPDYEHDRKQEDLD